MEEFYDHSEYPVATCYLGMTRNVSDISSLNPSFVGDIRPSYSAPDKARNPCIKQIDPYFSGYTFGVQNGRGLHHSEASLGLRNSSHEPLCFPSKSTNRESTDDEKRLYSWMMEARTHPQRLEDSKSKSPFEKSVLESSVP